MFRPATLGARFRSASVARRVARQPRGRTLARALVVVSTLLLTAAVMAPTEAGAATVSPTVVVNVPDNVDCADLGYGGNELRVVNPGSASYDDTAGSANPGGTGPLVVTLSVYPKKANQPKTSFDFTANMGIDAVIVRGGQNSLGQPISNWYAFDDPADAGAETDVTSATKLSSRNANGKLPAIAQIAFCYDVDETATSSSSTTTTTTDTSTTTTTDTSTSTTTATTTSTTTETSTTTTDTSTTTTDTSTTTTDTSTTTTDTSTTTTDTSTTTTDTSTTTTDTSTTTTDTSTTTTDTSTTETTTTTTTSGGGGGGGGGGGCSVPRPGHLVIC